ncbi:MAG TPA: TIGR04283 family arsenosugar biosynthesis glycosyltransferase [Thermoanaerobaculia bacterium]|nr:TIGR04283 family arsenosugar biosynthesis glycosyltransferase [Thermoanaerobaculia bacterium]
MRRGLAVVIPAMNEEKTIAAAVASAIRAGAMEVVVADGGSRDATPTRAIEAGARVLACPAMRSRQMNLGAAETTAGVLLFLHADSELPEHAAAAIEEAMEQGVRFGGFRVEFVETVPRLRLAARMINTRTSLTRCPWGDQGQFIAREDFESAGGFREIPLMEDYALAVEMKRRARTCVLPLKVRTSGRRFLKKGLLRTAVINWSIITGYRLGIDPHKLARWYRK